MATGMEVYILNCHINRIYPVVIFETQLTYIFYIDIFLQSENKFQCNDHNCTTIFSFPLTYVIVISLRYFSVKVLGMIFINFISSRTFCVTSFNYISFIFVNTISVFTKLKFHEGFFKSISSLKRGGFFSLIYQWSF